MKGSRPVLTGLDAKVFEAAMHRVDALQNELQRLAGEYADREDRSGNQIVLRALGLIVGESRREILREARRRAERAPGVSDDSFRRSIGSRARTLDRLVRNYLSPAARPPGREIETLVRPLTRLVNTVFTDRELIFAPTDGYEIVLSNVEARLAEYAKNFSQSIPDALWALPRVTVISYPALTQDDVIQHLLLGHEIGHLVLSKEVSPSDAAPGTLELEALAFNVAYSEGVVQLRKKKKDVMLSPSARRALHAKLRSIFRELASDILGVRLMGPAYVIALADYEAVRNRWVHDFVSTSHPGLAWRLRTIIPEARRFLEVDRHTEPWERARAALDELEQMIPEGTDSMSPAEHAIIERSLELLNERLDNEIGEARLLVGELERLFDPVWDKLVHSIPPAEEIFDRSRPDEPEPQTDTIGGSIAEALEATRMSARGQSEQVTPWSQPIDWRIVLNAAVFYWADEAASYEGGDDLHLPTDPQRVAKRRELNEFVRGTIELAETHLRLQEVKDELDDMNLRPLTGHAVSV